MRICYVIKLSQVYVNQEHQGEKQKNLHTSNIHFRLKDFYYY